MSIEERMKNAVREAGITMTKLSEKTGMEYWKIQASLSGNRELRADEFFDICEALRIDPMAVIRGRDTP